MYQIGSRIENKTFNIANFLIIVVIAGIIISILVKNTKSKGKECRACPYCNSCNKGKEDIKINN